MKQSLRQLAFVSLVVAAVAGCADQPQQPSETPATPKAPSGTLVAPGSTQMLFTPPACPSTQQGAQQAIDQLLPQLFAPGNGRRGKAQNLSNDMEKARYANNVSLANVKADSLINFTLQQYYSGQLLNQNSDLAGTQQRIVDFITYIYCFNGYSPLPDFDEIFNATTSVLIRDVTPTTVVNDPAKHAGVKINQGDVPSEVNGQPFFGTYISVVKTSTPLPTSLDWYGIDGYKAGAFEFVSDPEVTFDNPVLTGVCISYDDAIVTSPNDIRLAHTAPANPADVAPGNFLVTTAGGSIEIAAPLSAGPLGLACQPLPFQAASLFGRTMDRFADLLLPPSLLAVTTGGSTGGTVRKFSPFGGVDSRLALSSTGPSSPVYIPLNATTTTAPVSVSVKTRNSQAGIDNIPVTFATSTAGSSFSPTGPSTNTSGTAASTWTLVAGANTGSGTPTLAPLVFTPAAASFSVNVIQETTLSFDAPVSLPGGSQGTAYPTTTFTASGGIGTYSWAVTSGTLPTGLALTTGGVLSGTTTTAGAFSFTVTVTSGGQTQARSYSVVIALPPITSLTLSFATAPSKQTCYALNVPMTPGIRVRVVDQSGIPRPGITVNVEGVTNNGAKVTVTPSSAVSDANGIASFGGPTFNKTGGYSLIASTTTPVAASVTSAKFTISPSCP
jgi:hypothetical protein